MMPFTIGCTKKTARQAFGLEARRNEPFIEAPVADEGEGKGARGHLGSCGWRISRTTRGHLGSRISPSAVECPRRGRPSTSA